MSYDPDVHDQCLDELVRLTKGLNLGIEPDSICKRRLWYAKNDQGHITPYKGITFWPQQENEAPGTMSKEDIGYGCGCAIIFPADHALRESVGKVLTCRARIRRKFIHQRLNNISLTGGYFLTTKVAHLPINQPLEAHRYEASLLSIRCWMREPRG